MWARFGKTSEITQHCLWQTFNYIPVHTHAHSFGSDKQQDGTSR